jgi:hypothetical protein
MVLFCFYSQVSDQLRWPSPHLLHHNLHPRLHQGDPEVQTTPAPVGPLQMYA